MHKNPLYLEDAARLRIDVSPIGAAEVMRAIDDISGAPPEVLDFTQKLLSNKSGG